MIGHLRGEVLQASAEEVLLEVSGVGYLVRIPLSTFYEVERRRDDGPVALFIHTHVREDAIELFGFHTERERTLFELLISVGGIGPRLGRVILSGMAPEDLLSCLGTGDVSRLTTIPGIGGKTAQRMVVELKDKVQGLAEDLPVRPSLPAEKDVYQALANLGYKPAEADRALAAARKQNPEGSFSELLRLSLRYLSRA
jgi:Holliday junction DNA helicase RuvA